MSTGAVDDPMPLRDRLRAALTAAMRARDRRAVAVLRTTLAAIDNAEAVDAADHGATAIEHSPVGVGAAEVARKHLAEADIEAIVGSEITERLEAAAGFERADRHDHARQLRAEADTLSRLL